MSPTTSQSRIVFAVTGSIAAFKAAQVVSRLVQNGNEVRVVATPGALRFVGSATFEGLTGKPVLTDIWEEGSAMEHIHLSRWADMGIVCPASANTIARMANGLAEDMVSALVLAWPNGKPLHVFPAMNTGMLEHPATQANIAALRDRGVIVHPTGGGNLACGEIGAGRLLEPEMIMELIKPSVKGSILITAGATREPIDGIRFVSNVSTGRTGATLADRLQAKGWQVTFLHGEASAMPQSKLRSIEFGSFKDLESVLETELASTTYDAVIHAAAVSDYTVVRVNGNSVTEAQKLPSNSELSVEFASNPKLLPRLREFSSNPDIKVVGFKLTHNASESETETIGRALLGPNVDAVVANDWSRISEEKHPGFLLVSDRKAPFSTVDELGVLIHELLLEQS